MPKNKGFFALGDQGSVYAKKYTNTKRQVALYCRQFKCFVLFTFPWHLKILCGTHNTILDFQLLRNTLLTVLYFKASILFMFTHVKRTCILRKLLFRIYKAYSLGFSAILLLPPEHAPLNYILPRYRGENQKNIGHIVNKQLPQVFKGSHCFHCTVETSGLQDEWCFQDLCLTCFRV